jgi:phenylacetate-coenzyme A ligase PaaK-like adenylate-forming protein
VLETALRQLRYGLSLAFSRRIRIQDLRELISDLLATRAELGLLDSAQTNLLHGGGISPETRRAVNNRRLQMMASMAYERTTYYQATFDRLGMKPDEVRLDTLEDVPVTPKRDLRAIPDAFISRSSAPTFRAFTTGTTGPPTSVWFSRYEIELGIAFGAIASIVNAGYGPDDVLQINISSRASLALMLTIESCQLIGAGCVPVGLIDPAETLSLLAAPVHLPGKKPQVSIMTTYPSYLAALVQAGEDLGYCAADFGLEQISCGGEVLTEPLRRRAEELFGARVTDGYVMTELFPMGGLTCTAGHIHLTPEQGLAEILDLDSHKPVAPGEVGMLVGTPFFPFRDTTLVLRYATGDVVRCLEASELQCELVALPAASQVLGKASFSVQTRMGRFFARDFQEVLDGERAVRLPCLYSVEASDEELQLHLFAPGPAHGLESAIVGSANDRGIPLTRVHLYQELKEMPRPLPVRADLHEATLTRYYQSAMSVGGTR